LRLSLGICVLALSYTLASSSAALISWTLMGVKARMPSPSPAVVAVRPGTKLNALISSMTRFA
jgi:hypothetical protein